MFAALPQVQGEGQQGWKLWVPQLRFYEVDRGWKAGPEGLRFPSRASHPQSWWHFREPIGKGANAQRADRLGAGLPSCKAEALDIDFVLLSVFEHVEVGSRTSLPGQEGKGIHGEHGDI
jgi:hypothetical protein